MPLPRPPRPGALRPEALSSLPGWARWARPGPADRAWMLRAASTRWAPEPLAAALEAAGAGPVRAVELSARAGSWRLSAEGWEQAFAAALGSETVRKGLRAGPSPLVVCTLDGGPLEDLPEPTLLGLGAWIAEGLTSALPRPGAGLRLLLPVGTGRLVDAAGQIERVLTAALNAAEDRGLGHLPPA